MLPFIFLGHTLTTAVYVEVFIIRGKHSILVSLLFIIKQTCPLDNKEVSKHPSSTFNIEGTHTTDNITVAKKFREYYSSVAGLLKFNNNAIKGQVWENL